VAEITQNYITCPEGDHISSERFHWVKEEFAKGYAMGSVGWY